MLVGHEVTVGTHENGSMPLEENLLNDAHLTCSLIDFNIMDYKKSEVLVAMFLQLSFLDWKEKVHKMNKAVEKASCTCKCKRFMDEEFLTGLALLI